MSGPLRIFILRSDGHLRNLQGFIGVNWKAMADQGRPLSVTVAEHKAQRSTPQNALYWARLSEIAETAWIEGRQFDREAWHHYFGSLYLPKRETPGGELVPVSTTTLDVADFTEYLNKIEAFAATDLGLELTL